MTLRLTLIFVLIFLRLNSDAQTVIKMRRQGGVSVISCKVNGLKLDFIFDTGASDVSISLTEVLFMMKNGYLSKDDLIGTNKYFNADGDLNEGLVVNLKEIEIAGIKLYNVKASTVKNLKAPLLLGQSAISKLGKIQLDLESNTITILSGKKSYTSLTDANNDEVVIKTKRDTVLEKSNDVFSTEHKKTDNDNLSERLKIFYELKNPKQKNKDTENIENIEPKRNNSSNYLIKDTVTIGKQVWLNKNLNVSTFRNGDSILHAKTNEEWEQASIRRQPAYCYFENNSVNGLIFGKLYNWYAIIDYRGLAPLGYHIPSIEEWNSLIAFCGNDWEKLMGNYGWVGLSKEATNSFGFSAIPSGYRSNFSFIGQLAYWWSSTSYNNEIAQSVNLWQYGIKQQNSPKGLGFSVRCVKD